VRNRLRAAGRDEIEYIEEVAKRRRVEGLAAFGFGFGRLSRLRLVSGFKLQFRSMNIEGHSDLAIGLIFTFLSSALRSLMSPGSVGRQGLSCCSIIVSVV
jgi:hypothetical protein